MISAQLSTIEAQLILVVWHQKSQWAAGISPLLYLGVEVSTIENSYSTIESI